MKKSLPFLLVLLLTLTGAFAQKREMSDSLRSMVETERAFAKTSADKGTRDAFLAFLADDGIVFQPSPVNGKKAWGERPKRPGLLSWEPIYADISQAGDMGYTTGPWEFRPEGAQGKPVAFGNFMTVWKKQADGTFKFVLDLGISNPQPTATQTLSFSNVKSKSVTKGSDGDIERGRRSLLDMEREFSKASAERGVLKADPSYLAPDVRLLHPDKFPFVGVEAARTALEASQGKLSWEPTFADVSRSGDLGYTYGMYQKKLADGKEETGNIVHVWKRQADGKWKVVIEVINPIPKQAS